MSEHDTAVALSVALLFYFALLGFVVWLRSRSITPPGASE